MQSSLQFVAWSGSTTAKSMHTVWRDLVSAFAVVLIVGWSGKSEANDLWLWGWVGVAQIHIMQDGAGSGLADKGPAGPVATSMIKAVPPANTKLHSVDASKKINAVPKAQADEISRTKDIKARLLRIVVM